MGVKVFAANLETRVYKFSSKIFTPTPTRLPSAIPPGAVSVSTYFLLVNYTRTGNLASKWSSSTISYASIADPSLLYLRALLPCFPALSPLVQYTIKSSP